jgi:hypothetical protein
MDGPMGGHVSVARHPTQKESFQYLETSQPADNLGGK